MLRKSLGRRLLAIALAGAMTLNCSSVTAFAKGTESEAVQIQTEEAAQEESLEQEEILTEDAGEASDESSEQSDAQVEENVEAEEEGSEKGSEDDAEENAAEAVSVSDAETEENAEEVSSDHNTSEESTVADSASEGATEAAAAVEVREQKIYDYDDDDIYVVAVLDNAEAVPDDAKLTVTPVYASSEDYNYNAYMKALNESSEEKEYTPENTLFYDVAFLYEEKDAEGNGTGRIIEYQPDFGAVKITFSFKQNQLSDQIETDDAADQDLEILHLPLTDSVRESVDTTADAKEISKDDILVESVQNEQIDVDGGNVEFKVNGLSLIALAAPRKVAANGPVNGEIRLYAKNETDPASAQAISTAFPGWKNYGVLVYITDKEDKSVAGWQTAGINAPASFSTPFTFPSEGFYTFKDDGKTMDEADKTAYDPEKHNLVFRLYAKGWGAENYYNVINGQDGYSDTFEGFRFLGTAEEDGKYVISLKESEDMTYNVKVQYDPEDTIEAGDNYYVLVEVKHATTETTYVYEKITQTEADDLYENIGTDAKPWKTASGTKVEKFTGNEKCTAYLIYSDKDNLSLEDAINEKGCVTYKKESIQDKTPSADGSKLTVTQLIDFETIKKPTNDYDMFDVLGDGINYGLIADSIHINAHSQTNLATKTFTGTANLDSNLTGPNYENPGLFLVGDIPEGSELVIGDKTKHPTAVYVGADSLDRVVDDTKNNYVTKVSGDKASIDSSVNNLISHMQQISAEMAAKEDTLNTEKYIGQDKVYIDTTMFADDATIYLNADNLLNAIQVADGLNIKKKKDQIIVFNFKETSTVELKRIRVDYDGTGYKDTNTDWTGEDKQKNLEADQISRQIVWNMSSVTNLKSMQMAGGMMLLPNSNAKANVGGTSCGWVQMAGAMEMSVGGEFHSVYADLPALNQLVIRAKKTVEKKTPTKKQVFQFGIRKYDKDTKEFKTIKTLIDEEERDLVVTNNGGTITIPVTELSEGSNIFELYEIGAASGTEGSYETNTQKFYAQCDVKVSNKGESGVDVKIPGSVTYYAQFNEATGEPSEKLTKAATFDNTLKTTKLIIKKTVSGTDVKTDEFTFIITLEGDAVDGEYDSIGVAGISKVTFEGKKATVKLKAGDTLTIKGIPEGTKYTVEESKTLPKGYELESKEGDNGTITAKQDSTASFANKFKKATIDVTVTKAWLPSIPSGATVVFTLFKNNTATSKTVILDGTVDKDGETEPWKATFKDLPEMEGTSKINYTVRETTGYPGYTASTTEGVADGGTITNTLKTVDISAKKAWEPSAPEGAEVVFTLVKNGAATTQTVTLDGTVDENGESAAWTATFKNLPEYDGGDKITYTVKETSGPAGYTASTTEGVADGGTITNTLKTVDISAKKAWEPSAPEGAEVVFTLVKNGAATTQTVTLDGTVDENGESAAWTATFKNLPEYDGGDKITYTVKETSGPAGYTVSKTEGVADGETITNKQTKIKVSKREINGSEELPGAVIRILKGEEVIKEWTSGTTAQEITGLEVGTVYTLREITAPDGYTLAVDTTFSINPDGTINTTGSADGDTLLINDVKTKVKISKVDVTSQEEVAGATIQILDGNGNVVVLDGEELTWVSTDQGPHIIEGLKTDTEYTLHEKTAPAGYTVAADTKFTIGTDGTVRSDATKTEDDVLLVEDALTEVKISKIDIADGKEVAGAEIQILTSDGRVVDSWTSAVDDETTEDINEAIHVIKGLTTGVTYTLRETTAPDGYTVTADTTFTIDELGNVTSTGTEIRDGVILVADEKTVVKVSKVDIADSKEVAGAEIQILTSDGRVVDSWTSAVDDETTEDVNEAIHFVSGLKTGVTYTLRETVAPEGYAVTADTTFTIDSKGNVTSTDTKIEDGVLLVEDTKTSVKVSKVDIADSKEVAGAHIQIIEKDKDDQEHVVAEWDSTAQAHEVEGLKTGVTYTLRETVAPEGYAVTADTTFTIDKNGNVSSETTKIKDGVLLVEDAKTKVKVSKTDIANGKEVEGATIQILENGNVVEEWVSGKEAHEVEGLKTGVTYTLRETVAPKGYKITADTTFTIDERGNVTSETTKIKDGVLLVEDEKTSVKVSKVDVADGKEVEGAHIQIILKKGILDEETIVAEWDSTDKAHVVEGLEAGVTYILRETVAPDGYTVATETKFSIDEDGNVKSSGSVSEDGVLLVEDAKTVVKVSKVDIAGGKELEGATIQIIEKNEDGAETIAEEWISGKDAHAVEGLKTGVEYTLRETVAPDGYAVTADTTFTIDEKGKVTSKDTKIKDGVLLVEDAKTKVKVSKTDIADGKELEGAHIQVIDKDGNIVDEWDSVKKAHEIEGLLTGVEYTLRETVAPDGYTVTTDIKLSLDKSGKVTSSGPVTTDGMLLINDTKTKISVSKVDIADGNELEGAQIQIVEKDKDGQETIVEKWTSGKEAHEIEGLKTGVEYILRETVAPEGYTVAAETTFTINDKGEVKSTATVTSDGVILVEDAKTKISVSKVDIADAKELEGAHIQIIEKGVLSEKVITEWDSTTEPHVVEGLKTGVEYILRETVAPDGYTVTSDTRFTIDEKGKVTSTGTISEDGVLLVEDTKTKVSVSKTDIADGEELEGATIQILEKGEVIEEWVSGKEPHVIEGLKTGVEYTLKETVAPDGYSVTTNTTFTIDENGKVKTTGTISEDGVLLVEDSKTKVKVSKTDIADGKEVEGATIQIIEKDAEGKEKVVEEWTSGKKAHEVEGLKTGVEYTLRETVAPEGYTVTTDTTFTIDEKGKVTSTGTISEDGVLLVEDAKTKISVSKTDIADGKEVEGAKIRIIEKDEEGNEKVVEEWTSGKEAHEIEGLKTGVEYTLRETVAPEGYTVTTDTTFTIDETGKVTSTGTISEDGVLLVEDEKTKVSVSKTDVADGEELEGAHIQIILKEGIFGKETIIEEWDSTKEAHVVEGLKTGVEYILRETVAPDGYTVTTDTKFSIDETGKVTSTGTVTEDGVLLVEDTKTKVSVSKVDIADGEELEGAHIQILDSEGNVVEEWDSTKEAHEIEGLKTGEEYTLHETVAPEGYTVTTDTTFTIDEKGKVTSTGSTTTDEEGNTVLLVEDAKTKVSVSKTDIADGKELEGAHIQILDSEGNVVEEWDSTKEAHEIEGLKTGVTYTLKETVAPDGYTVTSETTFTIDEKGKVTSTGSQTEDGTLLINDAKTRISVSKVDIADGEEIAGATIQIVDAEGNVVEEWVSTEEAHVIEGLKTGVEYTLKETAAPDGYTVAAETTFTIDEKGNVTTTASVSSDGTLLVEDAKTKISVSKVDIADGEELEGAHIQIIDSEGNVVEEWDSTKEAHEIEGLKTGEEYTLRETVAPEGYTVTTDTTFTIDEKGNVTSTGSVTEDGVLLVEDEKTKISVSKVDIADGEELEGAHIQIIDSEGNVVEEWDSTKEAHEIEGLKTGEEYTLRETVAPEGYTVTTDTTFTIDEKGNVTSTGSVTEDGVLLVEDEKTKISVSKVDIADGKELEGAHIQIIDKDGNVVEEWDSTKEAHEIEGLKTGEEYTLRETVAPEGYTVTTDTTFTIDEKGKVTSTGTISEDGVLLVEDAKTKVKVSKVDIADGKEVEGARIQIIDKDGKVVEEWTSTKEAHEIEGLKTGEEYTLRETVAPDGYTVTTDTKFSIDEKGEVTSTGSISENGVLLVEDAKTVVKVSKVDVADGKELEGAHIQIIVKEGLFGKERVVEEWDSTKEAHEVIGLKTGVQYILRETVAPEGYAVTTDTKFTIDENGKVTSTGTVSADGVMLVEDAKTVVKVSKVDIADGKELEGAKIQLLENGVVIDEWVSGKEPHVITGLKTEVEYTLRETVAPEGYELTTDTTFIIDKYGVVTATGSKVEDGVILIEDARKGEKPHKKTKDSSNTGDDANAMLWLLLALGASGSLYCVARRRRSAK